MLFDAVTEKAEIVVSPAVLEVTVTVLVLEVAVTPAATGHRLIAAARFAAKVVVLELVAKVPAVEVPHAFVPLPPAITAAQEKLLGVVLLDAVTENGDVARVPSDLLVTVTVLVLEVAVTPEATGHRLSAAARCVARFVELASVVKVPAVAVVQESEPLVPGVTPPHA